MARPRAASVCNQPGCPLDQPCPEHAPCWCGDFRKAHGRAVPIEVLRARHAGRRVTTRMITDSKPVKPTKKPTKQRKKKR